MNAQSPGIASLVILCAGATFAQTTLPASETAVSFPGDAGVTLHGTLTMPPHAQQSLVPALVLIQGSGPTDRNGNQPPALVTDVLKQLADAFAQRGIASVRFDKRGMYANHADWPADKSKWEEFCRWEHFVGDVAAAFQFLNAQPGIAPNHVGLLGHSEGGLLALQAAAALRSVHRPPAAILLLSTPGRRMDAVIADQLAALLKKQGASAAEAKFYLDQNTRISQAILQTGQVPPDVPAGLAALYPAYLGAFLQSALAADPVAMAKSYGGPVLIVAGSKDTQVSAEKDAGSLDAALTSRPNDDHSLLLLPETSHNLKVLKTPTDPALSGPIAPDALTKITGWAAEKLSKPQTR